MGTFVALQATHSSIPEAESALEAAFAALSEVSRRLHPQSPDSDLARIGNSPLLEPVEVHPSTHLLLTLAQQLNVLTEGVFDPCLPRRLGRLADIQVTQGQVICRAPVALDFGGFAKGYAVDCAIEALLKHGCSAGLVNAGGDLRVFGSTVEPIYLRRSAACVQSNDLVEVRLSDAALAVSDARSPNRPAEHQGYYVRNTSSLRATDNQQAVVCDYAAVIASQAVIADALAKCVLLCPATAAEQALRAFDASCAVIQ
jgi:thiamine biosynthesis lipoprotein